MGTAIWRGVGDDYLALMVLSLIDVEPMQPSWGKVYQSGVIASEDWDRSGLIVSMAGNENIAGPCLWINMPDDDVHTLRDSELLAFVDIILRFLQAGMDVLIHCNEGKYRSTYMDMAVHMRGGRMSLPQAFEMIHARHPIAALRAGTHDQLTRLEDVLKGENT